MTMITVYDPAMCCSTGICGAEIDQKLVDFAADIDWLQSLGVEVKRINLSQEPALFVENELVKSVLEKSGVEGLPVIIAGEALLSSGQYPPRARLAEMAGLTPDKIAQAAKNDDTPSDCCGGSKALQESEPPEGCCGGNNESQKDSSCCC